MIGNADLAARYGGEEYLAYLYGDRERGLAVAEEIRKRVEEFPFPASTEDLTQTMSITISLGVSAFPKTARPRSTSFIKPIRPFTGRS